MIKQTDENWKMDLNQLLADSLANSDNVDYAKIGFYYVTKAPKYLYKFYADNDRNVEAVFSNKMWYSAPICFNDPYDCDFTIDKRATIDSLVSSIAQVYNFNRGSAAWMSAYNAVEKKFPELAETIDNLKS